jgi:hypothetical protein
VDASQSLSAPPGFVLSNGQQAAAAAIARLGGNVSPAIAFIGLPRTRSTDTALEYVRLFPKVRRLGLEESQATDAGMRFVKGLVRLEEVNLYGTKVTDAGLENLTGSTQLRDLNLNNTHVTDVGLQQLSHLVALQDLGLANTQVTDVGLEQLRGLRQLKRLCLSGTKITDAGLKHLEGLGQLEKLDIEGTQVTDAGLESLKGLSKLGWVYLLNTRVTDEGVKRLKAALPHWVCISHPPNGLSPRSSVAPMPIYVTPFYSSDGPQISVGAFSKRLAEANAGTISQVASEMKKEWADLPIEAMYVAAVRHYDLGRKDEAVYWFYSAQYRARLFQSLLSDANGKGIGADSFEATSAYGAFHQLAGEYINGYAFGHLDKLKATIKAVQSEYGTTLPDLASIYPSISFVPAQSWADKNRETSAGLSKLLDIIETQAEKIKAERKKNGIDGKY